MIVKIGKILRIEVNGQVNYININSFSLKEVNNFVNFLQDDKLVVRVLLSDLSQSIEEIIQLTDETQEGERGESGEAGRNGENGDKGLDGKDGSSGVNGIDGRDGRNGQDGVDGKDGQDGKDGKDFEITPSLISEIRGKDGEDGAAGINGTNGERGSDGTNGIDGINGLNGSNGIDGQSFIWSGEYDKSDTYEKNELVEYQGASWIAIKDVPENQPPLNPTQNKAFWDLAAARGIQGIQGLTGATGLTGQGVPTGGTAGQHLAKIDATNYNTQWVNPEVDSNDKVGVSANDTTPSYLIDKVVAGTNVTVTELNDGGVETLQISASGGNSVFTPTINSTNMIEVSQESDFGIAVGGAITLTTNTTYFVRGNVNCSNRLIADTEGILICGWDRDKDGLTHTGTGDFITATDVNFELANLKLSSTNSTGGEVVLRAVNYTEADYNKGRLKILTIINCQFRNCFDVLYIEGYDLTDIQQTLFWYIESTTIGCQFKNTSKLQISSCEFVRWFRESTIPTPSSYATASMVEVLSNGTGGGNGATNISGCIFHPQQTQNGIDIKTGSTTGFGTISGNTFINIGLTTGETFLGDSLTPALGAYSEIECLKFDILANNGILNSTAGVVMTMEGNTTDTVLAINTPTQINTGGLALAQAFVRYSVTTAGRVTYNGTKQIYASIHASISYSKQGGGGDDFTFYLYKNGVVLNGSATLVRAGGNEASISMVYGTLFDLNDYIEIWIENTSSTDNMRITDWQVLIRE